MTESKKSTGGTFTNPEPEASGIVEPKTGNPTLEQVQAERERVDNAAHPQLTDSDVIPPPRTSTYVTIPAEMRAEGDDDGPLQVVQVRTYDDGRVPQVSLRSESHREYVVDWTQDLAATVIPTSRT